MRNLRDGCYFWHRVPGSRRGNDPYSDNGDGHRTCRLVQRRAGVALAAAPPPEATESGTGAAADRQLSQPRRPGFEPRGRQRTCTALIPGTPSWVSWTRTGNPSRPSPHPLRHTTPWQPPCPARPRRSGGPSRTAWTATAPPPTCRRSAMCSSSVPASPAHPSPITSTRTTPRRPRWSSSKHVRRARAPRDGTVRRHLPTL